MTRHLTVWITAIIVALSMRPAWAHDAQFVSGDFVVPHAVPTSITEFDSKCLIELDSIFELDGSLVGEFEAQFTILHFGPCLEPAPELFFATGTYEGLVLNSLGSFDFIFFGHITATGEASGELIITEGFGGLEDIGGFLHLEGTAGVDGTYSGVVWED